MEYRDLNLFLYFRRGINEAGTVFFYKNMRGRVYYSQCSLMIVGLIINYLLHASVVLTCQWFFFFCFWWCIVVKCFFLGTLMLIYECNCYNA